MAKTPTSRSAVVPLLAEAFREHGYEGASMAVLQDASGLGRGSLYHFFPGGKTEMAAAVLDDVESWFRDRVFAPLRAAAADPSTARRRVDAMLDEVDSYFRSGRRACLQGMFAIGRERNRFAEAVSGYFTDWIVALTAALQAAGDPDAQATATRAVAAMQGGIVLARALDDPQVFAVVLAGIRSDDDPSNVEPS